MTTVEDPAPVAPIADHVADTAPVRSRAYVVYATFILGLIYALGSTDSSIMSILLVPIQKELKVSDLAMGTLAGAAFTAVQVIIAVPVARLADRSNRRNIIAIAVTVWSLFTGACGLATSYATLLAARIGVAVGEAGHGSSILSTIGDLYPRHRRGLAYGVISIGISIGTGVGASLVGWIGQHYGWRAAFQMMTVPGLVIGAIVFFTLKEPARGAFEGGATQDAPLSIPAVVKYVFSVPTLRRLVVANIVMQGATSAYLVWMPAFLVRVHHLSIVQMSAGFGLTLTLGASTAHVLAGWITDRMAKQGERWRLYYCCMALVVGLPFVVAAMLVSNTPLTFLLMFLWVLCSGGVSASATVAVLGVVKPQLRGRSSAVLGVCTAVVGMALGPSLFGAITDALKHSYGDYAVRYSLLGVPALWLLAGALFVRAGRTADRDWRIAVGG